MTLDDVRKRVAEIDAMSGDDEAAHAAEDQLHEDVLRYIARANGAAIGRLAAEALKTRDIDFMRWCA